MSDWQEIKADQFCISVRDGTHDSPKPTSMGQKLITSRHIIGGRIDLDAAYLISEGDFEAINRRSRVDQWDVLITMIGTVGEPCLVRRNPDFAIKNIGLFKSKGEIEGKWLYYYLRNNSTQQLIRELSAGTTQSYISLGALRGLSIRFPRDRQEMENIVSVLGALDDKIELNRRMNETLEAMARAIFKDWFVDFGPTRTKMAMRGEDPQKENITQAPYLAADIWSLFPDTLDDEGKPAGWDFGLIGDLGKIAIGGLWGNDEPQSIDEIAYACLRGVDLQHLREQGVANKAPVRYGTPRALASRSIGPRDVLIASSGAGPCGRPLWVGAPGFFQKNPTTYSNFVKRITCISETAACYVDRLLFEMRQSGEIAQFIIGTSVPNLNDRALLGNHRIILPPEPLMKRFYDFSLTAQKHQYSGQNETLAATRDFLLPKLMSGEVRVKDAERMIGEAA